MSSLNKSGTGYAVRTYTQLLILVLAYFISAGSISIIRAWIYFMIAALSYTYATISLIRNSPDLMNERAGKKENTLKWDKYILAVYLIIGVLGIHIVAGFDHRFGKSGIDIIWMIPGTFIYFVSTIIQTRAMIANRYFEATVRIQKDRNQEVINKGPYSIVRHPGYACLILSFIAIPLMTGSVNSYGIVVLVTIIMVVRTYMEDKLLINELPGYPEYTKEVKFRLIPGIW